ncbi:MAG: hypothetical protein ACO1RX_07655 [Candidatus Sericytochromatia bacterium]
MDFNILITTNGPGEMSAWVQPMIHEIRTMLPHARILIALVPCPHSSGYEEQFSTRFYGATVLSPKETLHYIVTGNLPSHVVVARHGVILHLGGDQLFSVGLGWRTHFPVTVYTEKLAQWKAQVTRYFLRDAQIEARYRKKIPAYKLSVVGDLMADAVQPTHPSHEVRQKLNLRPDAPVVSLLPGSKPLKVLHSTAFLLKIVDELSLLMPQTQFILPQSPFTPLSQLRQAVQDDKLVQLLGGVTGKVVHDRNSTSLVTPQGNRVQIVPPNWHYNALQVSDLSLTLPGTNTAELAVLGIPMLVLLPLQRPELLPIDGPLGALGRLPLVGRPLKRLLVQQQLKRLPFLALPNQKAGEMIVPELVGKISAEEVASQAYELLLQPLQRRDMAMRLRELMDTRQTASRILMELLEILHQHDPRLSHLIPHSPEGSSLSQDSDSTSSGFKQSNNP